jgi:hypothetical protein
MDLLLSCSLISKAAAKKPACGNASGPFPPNRLFSHQSHHAEHVAPPKNIRALSASEISASALEDAHAEPASAQD